MLFLIYQNNISGNIFYITHEAYNLIFVAYSSDSCTAIYHPHWIYNENKLYFTQIAFNQKRM